MIKDNNVDIKPQDNLTVYNSREKRARIVGGAGTCGECGRSRAQLSPKSDARWLISIKPNYYLRSGSALARDSKTVILPLFLVLYFVIFFFFVPLLFYGCGQSATVVCLGRGRRRRTKLNYRTWFGNANPGRKE